MLTTSPPPGTIQLKVPMLWIGFGAEPDVSALTDAGDIASQMILPDVAKLSSARALAKSFSGVMS